MWRPRCMANFSGSFSTSTRSCRISIVSYSFTVSPTLRSAGPSEMSTRPLSRPLAGEQLVDAGDQPELRVGQVHRVDRMLRERHPERLARHDALLVVGHDRGLPLAPRSPFVPSRSMKIHRGERLVAVGDAVAHPRADEGEVRVGVARLDLLLLVGELAAQLHLVVPVLGVRREERVPRVEELREPPAVVMHAAGEALVEVAGRRVQRAVERLAGSGRAGRRTRGRSSGSRRSPRSGGSGSGSAGSRSGRKPLRQPPFLPPRPGSPPSRPTVRRLLSPHPVTSEARAVGTRRPSLS